MFEEKGIVDESISSRRFTNSSRDCTIGKCNSNWLGSFLSFFTIMMEDHASDADWSRRGETNRYNFSIFDRLLDAHAVHELSLSWWME